MTCVIHRRISFLANSYGFLYIPYHIYIPYDSRRPHPQAWLPVGLIEKRIEREVVKNLDAVRKQAEKLASTHRANSNGSSSRASSVRDLASSASGGSSMEA